MTSKNMNDFFFVKYASQISRTETNSTKSEVCKSLSSGNTCRFDDFCIYSHHPAKVFVSEQKNRVDKIRQHWTNNAEFQMWVLSFAKSSSVPKQDKARMDTLFDHVITNPALYHLSEDIKTYNDLLKNQKEQEDHAKDVAHKYKKAQGEQLRREADTKERKDRKEAADLKASMETEAMRKRCENIVKLRESVYKSDQCFHFEASFLPPFMKDFLQQFDIERLSSKIKFVLNKDLNDEPEGLLTAIETFLHFISAVYKLEHRRSVIVGDQKKNAKIIEQCEKKVQNFVSTGAQNIFSQMLGSPLLSDLKVNS